jgi:hypothetical protein
MKNGEKMVVCCVFWAVNEIVSEIIRLSSEAATCIYFALLGIV